MKRMMMIVSCLVVAACTDEVEPQVDEVEQQACTPVPGRGCTVKHPIGWTRNGVGCVEAPGPDTFLNDGEEYTAIGVPTILFGVGQTTLVCDGGCLKTKPFSTSCRRSGGDPQ